MNNRESRVMQWSLSQWAIAKAYHAERTQAKAEPTIEGAELVMIHWRMTLSWEPGRRRIVVPYEFLERGAPRWRDPEQHLDLGWAAKMFHHAAIECGIPRRK